MMPTGAMVIEALSQPGEGSTNVEFGSGLVRRLLHSSSSCQFRCSRTRKYSICRHGGQ